MKKIFEQVRKWTGKQIPDKAIEMVLEVFADADIYFPSDFTVSLTKEQMQDAKKANLELNEKTKALFMELNHDGWGKDEVANQNIATIIFGLVLTANGDTLSKEVKDKVKVSDAYKGGKPDVDFVKSIDYPISLKRVEDIKEYLDTKVTHPFPEVMFEDIRHTKKFTDVPWGVLTHIVSYYHAYDGDVSAKDILGYVKTKMLKEVPMNKRGANIKGHSDATEKRYRYSIHLTNDDILDLVEAMRVGGATLTKEETLPNQGKVYSNKDGDLAITNDEINFTEKHKQFVDKLIEETPQFKGRVYNVETFAKDGANVGFGDGQKLYDRVREWSGQHITNDEIKSVIDTLSEDGIRFPEDFVVEHEEQVDEELEYEAHQEAIHEKTEELLGKLVVGKSVPLQQKYRDITWALVVIADGDDLTNFIELEMKNGGNLDTNLDMVYKAIGGKKQTEKVIEIKGEKVKYIYTPKNNPIYYALDKYTYDSDTEKWNFISSYGSSNDWDVKNDFKWEMNNVLGIANYKNGSKVPENTEVSVTEFNKYFMRNYGHISHSLTNKQVQKFLDQDVIKRVSLSKKADYFQDYLLANGLADDVELKKGANIIGVSGNIKSIEKKVAEVNVLIEMATKNNVTVTDTSNTWQSPMKYKPFTYSNGVLYENYDELDLYLYAKKGEKKWKIVKNKYTKGGDGTDTQKEVLNNVAKMYRKELKYYADYDNYYNKKAKNGANIKGKSKKEISDMYWQKAENLEEEINSDKGGETSGMNIERIIRLEKERDKYRSLAIKHDTPQNQKAKQGTNIKKVYPKTDLSIYTTKELYALYGAAEKNWGNDNGSECNRIQQELDKRKSVESQSFDYGIGGL